MNSKYVLTLAFLASCASGVTWDGDISPPPQEAAGGSGGQGGAGGEGGQEPACQPEECVVENATATCVDNECAVESCDEGFADCNGQPADGCETDVLTNVNTCGDCQTKCEAQDATCVDGACGCLQEGELCSCDFGWADCDDSRVNGCEVDTRTDEANCGECGNVCEGPGTCIGSGYCNCGSWPSSIPITICSNCLEEKCCSMIDTCVNDLQCSIELFTWADCWVNQVTCDFQAESVNVNWQALHACMQTNSCKCVK